MRTSTATVCLSGGLVEKLHACARAGFDGVEIMDADLIAAPESPEEIRALCDRLGLTIDLFQPFRDVEGVDDATFTDNLRRAEAKFAVMRRLGADTMLVCSNVGTATIDDDALAARQLRALGEAAAAHGIRIAYEALAWGRFVDDYRHAWRIVELADHPNVGTCLDSFHVLSRGHDPAQIAQIPGEKIFFLQLADAPALDMDVLSWSRHHRLFPGEGDFDLVGFARQVVHAGYTGPWSLEVFNDTFRQTDVVRTAAHARRSLTSLADRVARSLGRTDGRLAQTTEPTGVDFVEVKGEDLTEVDVMLNQLGFTFRGTHRSKPVRLWTAGSARIVLNEQQARDAPAHIAGLGLDVASAGDAATRAGQLGAPSVFRRTYAGEHELRASAAPDGTQIFWNDAEAEGTWVSEFSGGGADQGLTATVDHVNLTQPWQDHDEAVLFYTSVLGLTPTSQTDVPGPIGLVRSQVMRNDAGTVRIPLNVAPPASPALAQHVAVRCDDVVSLARRARDRGLEFLPIGDNYYDDLVARFDLAAEVVDELRELDLLYDRDEHGEFVHFYTPTIGQMFMEFVERRSGYEGYGATNAPIRLAAQRRIAG